MAITRVDEIERGRPVAKGPQAGFQVAHIPAGPVGMRRVRVAELRLEVGVGRCQPLSEALDALSQGTGCDGDAEDGLAEVGDLLVGHTVFVFEFGHQSCQMGTDAMGRRAGGRDQLVWRSRAFACATAGAVPRGGHELSDVGRDRGNVRLPMLVLTLLGQRALAIRACIQRNRNRFVHFFRRLTAPYVRIVVRSLEKAIHLKRDRS